MYCKVPDCANNNNNMKISMFTFPIKDTLRLQQWLNNTGVLSYNKYSAICEFHFAPEMWEKRRSDSSRKLKPHAVPTIFGAAAAQVKQIQMTDNVIENTRSSGGQRDRSRSPIRKKINLLRKSNRTAKSSGSCSMKVGGSSQLQAGDIQRTASSEPKSILMVNKGTGTGRIGAICNLGNKVQQFDRNDTFSKDNSVCSYIDAEGLSQIQEPEKYGHNIEELGQINLPSVGELVNVSVTEKTANVASKEKNGMDYGKVDDIPSEYEKCTCEGEEDVEMNDLGSGFDKHHSHCDLQEKYDKLLKLFTKTERMRVNAQRRYKNTIRRLQYEIRRLKSEIKKLQRR